MSIKKRMQKEGRGNVKLIAESQKIKRKQGNGSLMTSEGTFKKNTLTRNDKTRGKRTVQKKARSLMYGERKEYAK